jgi:hypothetical protein
MDREGRDEEEFASIFDPRRGSNPDRNLEES